MRYRDPVWHGVCVDSSVEAAWGVVPLRWSGTAMCGVESRAVLGSKKVSQIKDIVYTYLIQVQRAVYYFPHTLS